jgi:hypothetical protein
LGLCWDHPLAAGQALDARDVADRPLAELWARFGGLEPTLTSADFPVWLLSSDPSLKLAVPADAALPGHKGDAFRLLYRMVGGEDTSALWRGLAEVNPAVLRVYLARTRQ